MADILERLVECHRRIGRMCAEGRPPRMTIPANDYDDDRFISQALTDASDEIIRLRAQFAGFLVRADNALASLKVVQGAIALQGRILAGEFDGVELPHDIEGTR